MKKYYSVFMMVAFILAIIGCKSKNYNEDLKTYSKGVEYFEHLCRSSAECNYITCYTWCEVLSFYKEKTMTKRDYWRLMSDCQMLMSSENDFEKELGYALLDYLRAYKKVNSLL